MVQLTDLAVHLQSPAAHQIFRLLYGADPLQLKKQQKRWLHLAGLFQNEFPGHEQVRLFSTPGRTEVGGNHTDHQHGRALCAAVDLDIIAIAAPNQDAIIRVKSEGYANPAIIDLSSLQPVPSEYERSPSLIRGIAAAFAQRGCKIGGFDAFTTSRIPKGSGLSSSAAFEILIATIINQLYCHGQSSPIERAIIAQYAENEYYGKPSGMLDPCGCAVGGFISIDFLDPLAPRVEPIPIDFEQSGYTLFITYTGGSHADLTDDYASIPHDMKMVAKCFDQQVLRHVDESEFWRRLPELHLRVNDRAILRAIHYFHDDKRVTLQTEALKNGQIEEFLRLVRASGFSSWTKLQNTYSTHHPQNQPITLGLAISEEMLAGRGACRVHGGGFAGTIQAFVPDDLAEDYRTAMQNLFGETACRKARIRSTGAIELELT